MSIVWDEVGTRLYDVGLDRGVLYLDNGTAVPWNGLVSVDEVFEETNSTVYLDGTKIFDNYSLGDFKATLNAFTYPDEFLPYQGFETFENSGMLVTGQNNLTFGLSYRTLVANDVLAESYGYQIHLLYNLLANPEAVEYKTYSTTSDTSDFGWSISGTPEYGHEYYPTAHIVIDSVDASTVPHLLTYLEDVIYGTVSGSVNASLPDLKLFAFIVPYFESMVVSQDDVTGLSEFAPGYGEVTKTKIDGVVASLPRSNLVPSNVEGFYTLTSG